MKYPMRPKTIPAEATKLMTRKFQRIELKETAELEPLLLRDIEVIEPGLSVIDNQLSTTDGGRPDILALDEDRTLVLIELKNETATVEHIDQAIRYYEWIKANLAWLGRPFPKIDVQNDPRVLLIAPGFDDGIRRLVRYLTLNVELFTYVAIRDEITREVGLICDPLEIEPTRQTPTTRSMDEIIAYCTDGLVVEQIKKVLVYLQQKGLESQPWKGGKWPWLEFRLYGEGYCWLGVKRKWFKFEYWDEDKEESVFSPKRFTSFVEWEKECNRCIDKWF
jgi:Endonuclease NucS C-terminal domain